MQGFDGLRAELRLAEMRLKGEVADSMSAAGMSGARDHCATKHDAGVTRATNPCAESGLGDSNAGDLHRAAGPKRRIVFWHSITTSDRAPSLRAAPNGDCTVLQVYSHRDIPWILVQGQPTSAATRAFGVLRHEGGFPMSRLIESEQRLVLREIAEHEFARIPKATAQRLLSVPTRLFKGRLTRWFSFRAQAPMAG